MTKNQIDELLDRSAQMVAHVVTRALLASFTLEEAIAAVEEGADHVAGAGGDEIEERLEKGQPHASEISSLTAAICRGIREGHKENLEHEVYGT